MNPFENGVIALRSAIGMGVGIFLLVTGRIGAGLGFVVVSAIFLLLQLNHTQRRRIAERFRKYR